MMRMVGLLEGQRELLWTMIAHPPLEHKLDIPYDQSAVAERQLLVEEI